jgi:hypothetical protein
VDLFLHIKVLFSMILGLGVAHLLRGVSRIVQHPKKFAVYWVHLTWTLFLFLYLIHFWWWEFALSRIPQWTFPLYFFLAIYATLLYLICSLFFPEEIDEYNGFRNYFYYRRDWLFGFLAALFALDFVDTFIKGPAYRAQFGAMANIRDGLFIVLCLLAIKVSNRRFHAALACFAVLFEIFYILKSSLTAPG